MIIKAAAFQIIVLLASAGFTVAQAADPNTLVEQSRKLRAEIIRARFMPLNAGNSEVRQSVQQLSDQLETIKLKPRKPKVKEPVIKKIIETPKIEKPAAVVKNESEVMDAQTLAKCESMAQKPELVAEPLALAQTLFACGQYKYAAIFYQASLNKEVSQGRRLTIDDKAWILLQIAQCKKDEPVEAVKALDLLLEQYPNSTWSRAAYVKKEMLLWMLNEKPKSLAGNTK